MSAHRAVPAFLRMIQRVPMSFEKTSVPEELRTGMSLGQLAQCTVAP
jgi:hypothetical protein